MTINIEKLTEQCSNKECPVIDMVKNLSHKNSELALKIKELEARQNMDSSNSSKPPSTDGFKRNNIKSTRKKSDKKQGGQLGHPGSTLVMSDNPDYEVKHSPEVCTCCGESLVDAEEISIEKRQVIDVKIVTYVTEHRASTKKCPHCNAKTKALFPDGIDNNIQYGNSVKTLSTYMTEQQLIPYERTTEFLSDIFGVNASEATLVNNNNQLYDLLEPAEEKIKELLLESDLVHKDETGVYVGGKLHWVHGTSTEKATHYQVHAKRGSIAMDEDGFLTKYKGTVVHDFWSTYFNYDNIIHALCNAHLLRELTGVYEEHNQAWADKLSHLLVEINTSVSSAKEAGLLELLPEVKTSFLSKYDNLLVEGLELNPKAERSEHQRGKVKQSKSYNLLRRFRDYKTDILRFMLDFKVPFTNNQAERDIRMVKLKQKISGTFRSFQGAKTFCRIRAYISTVKKNGASVFEELQNAFLKKPFIPASA